MNEQEKDFRDSQKDAQKQLDERLKRSDRGYWHPGVPVAEDARVIINSTLTTDDHVGKHPAEPHKEQEEEANKVGRPKLLPGVDKVKTIERTDAAGNVTDQVVVSPAAAASSGSAALLHKHDAVGTAAHIEAETGKTTQELQEKENPKLEKAAADAAKEAGVGQPAGGDSKK